MLTATFRILLTNCANRHVSNDYRGQGKTNSEYIISHISFHRPRNPISRRLKGHAFSRNKTKAKTLANNQSATFQTVTQVKKPRPSAWILQKQNPTDRPVFSRDIAAVQRVLNFSRNKTLLIAQYFQETTSQLFRAFQTFWKAGKMTIIDFEQ